YVHKSKYTDKHEHFIKHLVYIVVRDRTATKEEEGSGRGLTSKDFARQRTGKGSARAL
ncbi:hypothetical protein BHE74_00043258, partial [Ensete ventricosum]